LFERTRFSDFAHKYTPSYNFAAAASIGSSSAATGPSCGATTLLTGFVLPTRLYRSFSLHVTCCGHQKKTRLTDAAWARQVAKIYGSWVGEFPEIDDPPPDEPESF
jgi:hypothetical protein